MLHRRALVVLVLLLMGAAPAASHAEERWALVIGLDAYTKAPALSGSVNDARLMRQVLIDRCGLAPAHVMLLSDAEATHDGMLAALDTCLLKKAHPGDSVLVYFSGHGVRSADGSHDGLLPLDADGTDPGRCVLDVDIMDRIRRSPAAEIAVILDAGQGRVGGDSRGVGVSISGTGWERLSAMLDARTVLFAPGLSTVIERPLQRDSGRRWHGAFTFALAAVLGRSEAGLDFVGLASEVRRFLRDKLEDGDVEPLLRGATARKVPLGGMAAALPTSQGQKLSVSVGDFDGDAAGVTAQIRKLLEGQSYLQLVSVSAGPAGAKDLRLANAADRWIRGRVVNGRLTAQIYSSGGLVKEVSGTDIAPLMAQLADELRRSCAFASLADLHNPGASFHVQIATDATDGVCRIGQPATFRVVADRDCYITLIDVATDGTAAILFPNKVHADNHVRAGQQICIPDPSMGFNIKVGGPPGREMVKAIATVGPLTMAEVASASGPFAVFADPVSFRAQLVRLLTSAVEASKDLSLRKYAGGSDWAESSLTLQIRTP